MIWKFKIKRLDLEWLLEMNFYRIIGIFKIYLKKILFNKIFYLCGKYKKNSNIFCKIAKEVIDSGQHKSKGKSLMKIVYK